MLSLAKEPSLELESVLLTSMDRGRCRETQDREYMTQYRPATEVQCWSVHKNDLFLDSQTYGSCNLTGAVLAFLNFKFNASTNTENAIAT